MTKKIILTKGIPASGKTTWAKQKVKEGQGRWTRINKDEISTMIHCDKFSKEREKVTIICRDILVDEMMTQGKNIIIDDTNLHPKHEEYFRKEVGEWNLCFSECDNKYELEVRWFPIAIEDAKKRNRDRQGEVPDYVIDNMYKQYVEAGGPEPKPLPQEEEVLAVEHNPELPSAILVDLDGTLSLFKTKGHRVPCEQGKGDQDADN